MLRVKRDAILKNIEEIETSYDFLTDISCVEILDRALSELTHKQFCWNDIRDKLLEHKHKFGNDKEVGTFVLWVDYRELTLKLSIFKVEWFYFLTK